MDKEVNGMPPAEQPTPTTATSIPMAPGEPRQVLTLRDVRDVEAYVLRALNETGLPVADSDLGELVPYGVEAVYRLERALPPERRLGPVLDGLLRARLADRWRSLDRPRDLEPVAAAC